LSFLALLPKAPSEVVCDAAADAAEPDASLGFRVTFQKALCSGALVSAHLEVFGLDVDGDVLAIVFVFDLGLDHPLKDLLPALGEFGCLFGHSIVEDLIVEDLEKDWSLLYATLRASFLSVLSNASSKQ
jgi:hypothetical protein